MVTVAMIEEHSTAFVESLQADPVFSVHGLLLHRDIVGFVIPYAEPLRLTRLDREVLIPLPETKLFDRRESFLILRHFVIMLVIDPWQKLSFLIVAIKVPPRSEVVGRGERALELAQSSQVPKHVIEERTVPLLTMVVD